METAQLRPQPGAWDITWAVVAAALGQYLCAESSDSGLGNQLKMPYCIQQRLKD